MTYILTFNVDGQFITRIDTEEPVAKCRNLFKAKFNFLSSEWTGLKTALFIQGDKAKAQLLDSNNECIVPWEFFDVNSVSVGHVSVFCGDLVTANTASVVVGKSGYVESDATVPPTPSVYQEIIQKLTTMIEHKPEEIERAVTEYLTKNPVLNRHEENPNSHKDIRQTIADNQNTTVSKFNEQEVKNTQFTQSISDLQNKVNLVSDDAINTLVENDIIQPVAESDTSFYTDKLGNIFIY